VANPSFLAIDLGAGSGRAIVGSLEGGRVHLEEKSRFPNEMLVIRGHWHWNLFTLFEAMKAALGKAAGVRSMAVDTWGVDFGLLARDGSILGLPYTYRDPRTEGIMDRFFKQVPRERVYAWTGNQFMPFNSLFQLFAMKEANSPLLEAASDLLFMPDLFNYLFTGEKRTEFTYATTSQLYNPVAKGWEEKLFEALGVPSSVMQEIVPPGTPLGPVEPRICRETGSEAIPVVAVTSHDTASAVAAVPAEGEDWAYISSGTWSLMGVERREPVLGPKALDLNFTNEGGAGGTFRILKNIAGLWLLDQCRKAWGTDRSYEDLMAAASSARPFQAFLDPDWSDFLNPPDMPGAIEQCLKRLGQPVPDSEAGFVRVIMDSLALKYRQVLDQLRVIDGKPINRIHVMGGGARNRLLCQFTSNATALPVAAGPVEATAVGNIMMQALAMKEVGSLAEMRDVIRRSFKPEYYEPEATDAWEAAYERFQEVVAG
jgi:rhamnulokinase